MHDFIDKVLEGTLQADNLLGCGLGQDVPLVPVVAASGNREVLAQRGLHLGTIAELVGHELPRAGRELIHLVVASLPVGSLDADRPAPRQDATWATHLARARDADPHASKVFRVEVVAWVVPLLLQRLAYQNIDVGLVDCLTKAVADDAEGGLQVGRIDVLSRVMADEPQNLGQLIQFNRDVICKVDSHYTRTCWKMDLATSRNWPSRSVGALPVVWSCRKEAARRVSSKSPPMVAC